jgi:predicted GIY-YIG superfamily endonuclease
MASKRDGMLYIGVTSDLLAQLPHFSDQNLFKSMGYDIV